jgi:general secretion pathway protein G
MKSKDERANFETAKSRRSQAGFTLVEIMVVVAIIGMLASLAGVSAINQYRKTKRSNAKTQIILYSQSADLYYLDNDRYPTTSQGLNALAEKPSTAPIPADYPPGGYVKGGKIEADPWNNDYVYQSPGQASTDYSIESYAEDGLDGGEGRDADIESWDLNNKKLFAVLDKSALVTCFGRQ